MDIKDFKDYALADITEEHKPLISKLEQSLGKQIDEDVVLIAYKAKNQSNKTQG